MKLGKFLLAATLASSPGYAQIPGFYSDSSAEAYKVDSKSDFTDGYFTYRFLCPGIISRTSNLSPNIHQTHVIRIDVFKYEFIKNDLESESMNGADYRAAAMVLSHEFQKGEDHAFFMDFPGEKEDYLLMKSHRGLITDPDQIRESLKKKYFCSR